MMEEKILKCVKLKLLPLRLSGVLELYAVLVTP